jgi:sigma-B regulation protein RsbU (phosphoserine phosphatase)
MQNPPSPQTPRDNHFDLFASLVEEFAQAEDAEAAVRGALARIAEAMEAETASLFMLEGTWDSPSASLVCKACIGPSDITGLSLPATSGIVGRVVAENISKMVADVRLDKDFVAPPLESGYVVRSILCAPLSVRGQRLGAVEVINPRDGVSLFTPHDQDLLSLLATAASLAIVNGRIVGERVVQARMKRELELAASVQRNLLPSGKNDLSGIHGLNLPARGVSGDFYDILPLTDGRFAFALADVSGKGMNAALVMVKAATLFRCLGRQIAEPGRLLARISAELAETMSYGMFVTAVVGIYDQRSQEIIFSNAGHEPALLLDKSGRFRAYPADGPPLGLLMPEETTDYAETTLHLDGGSLYLFTDGCTESRLPDGTQLGAEGVQGLIERYAELPPAERIEAMAAALTPSDGELRDDITLMVLQDRRLVQRPSAHRKGVLAVQSFPGETSQLKFIRHFIQRIAFRAGVTAEWAQDLVLAADEACQNIIRHGYKSHKGSIEITLKRTSKGLELELVDFAAPVKEDECQGRDLDDVRPGGLGTHFIYALTDRVRRLIPPEGAGNRLVLTKYFEREGREK